jgi:hypothetical protein
MCESALIVFLCEKYDFLFQFSYSQLRKYYRWCALRNESTFSLLSAILAQLVARDQHVARGNISSDKAYFNPFSSRADENYGTILTHELCIYGDLYCLTN